MDIDKLDAKFAQRKEPIFLHSENNMHFFVMNTKDNSFDFKFIKEANEVLDQIEALPKTEAGILVSMSTSPKIYSTGFNLEFLKNEKAQMFEMIS